MIDQVCERQIYYLLIVYYNITSATIQVQKILKKLTVNQIIQFIDQFSLQGSIDGLMLLDQNSFQSKQQLKISNIRSKYYWQQDQQYIRYQILIQAFAQNINIKSLQTNKNTKHRAQQRILDQINEVLELHILTMNSHPQTNKFQIIVHLVIIRNIVDNNLQYQMIKTNFEPKHKNSILSHISKISKGQLPIPFRFSSLSNSLSKTTGKYKQIKQVLPIDSQRVLPTLKKEEIQLLLHSDTPPRINDIQKLIDLLLAKKYATTLRTQETSGLRDALIGSVCLRMFCNNILQQLQKKGRLGFQLKGINKKILNQIQNQVGEVMNKEIKLFQNRANFRVGCNKLGLELKEYKTRILQSISDIQNRQ